MRLRLRPYIFLGRRHRHGVVRRLAHRVLAPRGRGRAGADVVADGEAACDAVAGARRRVAPPARAALVVDVLRLLQDLGLGLG